ncbi:MAG: HEAT repeat domain-containing protein [Acidobacteriota bacterium]|nr:HEAT repeat domain-containing protein [Acidobacteriota bacterium]
MKQTRIVLVVLLLFAAAACSKSSQKSAEQPAYTAQESLAKMHLSEDFNVEIFLTEPQVMSPTEMVFDENGRIYVAEMLDYPDDPPPGKPVRSRIKLLEDNDGDGKYERVIVFADQVLQASGILPWKGGVIVTSAPDIFWMKDTDGDGKADIKQVLFTGFPKVNPEARITNPRYGIDNWIYFANHGREGRITSPAHPEREALLVRGTDFRFNPTKDLAENSSGIAQFGLTFDEWGNEFITDNTTHLRHVILPYKYLSRAPLLEVPAVALNIYEGGVSPGKIFPLTGPQEWRKQRTVLRQQRYDEQGLNRTEHVGGYFSGASGGTVYNGDAWPAEYRGSIFNGEVSANLIHRDTLTPDGMTFKASRAKEGVEFLASEDQWFRPCNFANAPDGNLYFMDIYRLFIETPESIPEEIKKGMDFYAGDSLGRIYKLTAKNPRAKRDLKPRLGSASTEELVKTLEHENGWHRTTAQRLMVERQDKTAIPFLKTLVAETTSPLGKAHALWTLEGLSALDESLVLAALKDQHPRVREHALRLAESFAKSKATQSAVLAMAGDADVKVQFQTAFTLGEIKTPNTLDVLADLAIKHGDNQWFRLAILSSVNDSAAQFFALLRKKNSDFDNKQLFSQLAALIGGKHDANELAGLLKLVTGLNDAEPTLNGLSKGLKLADVKNLRVAGAEAVLMKLLSSDNEALQKATWETARFFELKGLVQKALADAQNASLPVKTRVTAVRALRGGQFTAVSSVLEKLLADQNSPELQTAAIESLAAFDDANIASNLIGQWQKFSPDIRQKALAALLSDRERMKALLKALEDGKIERTMADPAMQAKLFDHPDKDVVARAQAFFKSETDERKAIVASYAESLKLTGDVMRGRDLFSSTCAKCHVPQQGRPRIGADLSGINNKTKEELLNSIMNPSEAIEGRFVNYILTTKDGRIEDGILANETSGAVTLRNADRDVTILRKNIAEIRASTISLMPEGYEKTLTKQQLADIIAYLRGGL